VRYEIWESVDRTEVTLMGVDGLSEADRRASTTATDGSPMRLVRSFEAADGEEAKRVRDAHYGFGPSAEPE